MSDESVTIPADLVGRVRDANAVWLATIGPNVGWRAKSAATNARATAVRELLAHVVRESPDDAQPCTRCEEPTGKFDCPGCGQPAGQFCRADGRVTSS